MEYKNAESMPI